MKCIKYWEINLKQLLTYVDPIYFIEKNLSKKASNENSAYFNILDFDKNYIPYYTFEHYPNYIASGNFDDILYYDVFKSEATNEYNMIIFVPLSENMEIMLQIFLPFKNNEHNEIATLNIVDFTEQESVDIKENTTIFFDNFNDLFGIIKNEIRSFYFLTQLT
jgi:hypothetical protein